MTNTERAHSVGALLLTFGYNTGQLTTGSVNEPLTTVAVDLIANLGHWLHQAKLINSTSDFEDLLNSALSHFDAEAEV